MRSGEVISASQCRRVEAVVHFTIWLLIVALLPFHPRTDPEDVGKKEEKLVAMVSPSSKTNAAAGVQTPGFAEGAGP